MPRTSTVGASLCSPRESSEPVWYAEYSSNRSVKPGRGGQPHLSHLEGNAKHTYGYRTASYLPPALASSVGLRGFSVHRFGMQGKSTCNVVRARKAHAIASADIRRASKRMNMRLPAVCWETKVGKAYYASPSAPVNIGSMLGVQEGTKFSSMKPSVSPKLRHAAVPVGPCPADLGSRSMIAQASSAIVGQAKPSPNGGCVSILSISYSMAIRAPFCLCSSVKRAFPAGNVHLGISACTATFHSQPERSSRIQSQGSEKRLKSALSCLQAERSERFFRQDLHNFFSKDARLLA
ncbi:hypothetical protein PaG_01179 [Moesziomyces aphidis]|uniref:Uncharacterized protein n=1 Tax=Moesziomyces aphidis TaxID=84754 RepID=W3VRS5_MOEAP|nr:hypothetical protein PaG_01179 [Moesziomyces aphidis]